MLRRFIRKEGRKAVILFTRKKGLFGAQMLGGSTAA
jgi:hypothetical protein